MQAYGSSAYMQPTAGLYNSMPNSQYGAYGADYLIGEKCVIIRIIYIYIIISYGGVGSIKKMTNIHGEKLILFGRRSIPAVAAY